MSCRTFLMCVVCILLPPLAVGLKYGIGEDFFINLLLTILGYIPGHVHGFYVLLSAEHEKKRLEEKNLRARFNNVVHNHRSQHTQPHNPHYGAVPTTPSAPSLNDPVLPPYSNSYPKRSVPLV